MYAQCATQKRHSSYLLGYNLQQRIKSVREWSCCKVSGRMRTHIAIGVRNITSNANATPVSGHYCCGLGSAVNLKFFSSSLVGGDLLS